jgi:hypothetical protein
MVLRFILQRAVLLCILLLTSFAPFAYSQTLATKARPSRPKEPAPRFNATSTDGEKFSNASIKGKIVLLEGETMKSGYLEQLKSDIAARFERDLRKPRAKPAVKPTIMEEDTALEQQKRIISLGS